MMAKFLESIPKMDPLPTKKEPLEGLPVFLQNVVKEQSKPIA